MNRTNRLFSTLIAAGLFLVAAGTITFMDKAVKANKPFFIWLRSTDISSADPGGT